LSLLSNEIPDTGQHVPENSFPLTRPCLIPCQRKVCELSAHKPAAARRPNNWFLPSSCSLHLKWTTPPSAPPQEDSGAGGCGPWSGPGDLLLARPLPRLLGPRPPGPPTNGHNTRSSTDRIMDRSPPFVQRNGRCSRTEFRAAPPPGMHEDRQTQTDRQTDRLMHRASSPTNIDRQIERQKTGRRTDRLTHRAPSPAPSAAPRLAPAS
jgi:hypothetical protein